MNAVWVSESLHGVHQPPVRGVTFLSTQGNAPLYFSNKKGYGVSSSLTKVLNEYDVVVIGTDLDREGTKLATVIRDNLTKPKHVVRAGLTGSGYVNVSDFYSPEEMKAVEEKTRLSREISSYFRKKGEKLNLVTSVAVGRIAKGVPSKVKVKPNKTATVTAVVKGMMKGMTASQVMRRLNSLYASGLIEYPRVEADYFPPDDRYQVYAHSPLTSRGYSDELISPFKEEEIPVNLKTAVLLLEEERLITPSYVPIVQSTLENFFNEDLTPKEEKKSIIEDCRKIAEDYSLELRSYLYSSSPNLPLIPVPTPQKSKKKSDELLEEMIKAQKQAEELSRRIREERKKSLEQFNRFQQKLSKERKTKSFPQTTTQKLDNSNLSVDIDL